jgi:hypothetical protein
MGQLILKISSRRGDQTLTRDFETPGSAPKHSIAVKLANFLTGLTTGTERGITGSAPAVAISILGNMVAASGTITSAGAATANQTMTVAGQTLTAKTSGAVPANGEFNLSATVGTQATNIAAAINAVVALSGIVTATAALGVVTVTSSVAGVIGNGLVMANVNLGNVTVVTFASGAEDATANTLNF